MYRKKSLLDIRSVWLFCTMCGHNELMTSKSIADSVLVASLHWRDCPLFKQSDQEFTRSVSNETTAPMMTSNRCFALLKQMCKWGRILQDLFRKNVMQDLPSSSCSSEMCI